jgi:succinate-semialdehyde dehydrogenase
MTTTAVSIDPATGAEIGTYPWLTEPELDAFLGQSAAGYQAWRAVPLADRVAVLRRMAEELRVDADRIAALITAEMGKPTVAARAEVIKSADMIDWYAEHGPAMLADEPTEIGPQARVTYRPIGPILSVQPWNFPVWQPLRAAVPILLGGNAYILKPAPSTVGTSLAVAEALARTGLPEGAFTVLNAEPPVVGAAIGHEAVAGVTLTGGVGAGAAVAARAGQEVKKVVLELGGSDAFIVLADADIEAAASAAVTGRFQNAGQVCIAAKRFIVAESVLPAFTEAFLAKVAELRVGDPTEPETVVGPIARGDLREEIDRQVQASVAEGATLLAGGHRLEGPGFFYAPTVLGGVRPGMTCFEQEVFGPVAALVAAADLDEAIALANDSDFGLSASVWTSDQAAVARVADELEVGGVFVNRIAASDPRIPIGGVKKSGFGRELSHFGVHEFLSPRAVWVE